MDSIRHRLQGGTLIECSRGGGLRAARSARNVIPAVQLQQFSAPNDADPYRRRRAARNARVAKVRGARRELIPARRVVGPYHELLSYG